MPVPPVVGDPKKKETINESNYTHMRKNLPKQHRWTGISAPPAGDGRESRGTSPSGAVCAGPPAAQAEQTV